VASDAALIAVMRQSATEFRTLLTKAGRGVGLSPGLSEDLARASVWLQACGFAGGQAALDAIEGLASKGSDPGFISLSNRSVNSSSSRGNLSSAYIGVQLADAVQLGWPSMGEPFFFVIWIARHSRRRPSRSPVAILIVELNYLRVHQTFIF